MCKYDNSTTESTGSTFDWICGDGVGESFNLLLALLVIDVLIIVVAVVVGFSVMNTWMNRQSDTRTSICFQSKLDDAQEEENRVGERRQQVCEQNSGQPNWDQTAFARIRG